MTLSTHPTVVTGETWTAANQNTYVKGNFDEIAQYTAKGSIMSAVSATELAEFVAGSDGTLVVYDSAESGGVRAGQSPVPLYISAALVPISGQTAAGIQQVESSTGSPKPNWLVAYFDDTVQEHLHWFRHLPSLMGDAPKIRVFYYMVSATSGNIKLGARISTISDGDSGVTANAFAGVANTGQEAVPTSAAKLSILEISVTQTDSWAKDDVIIIDLYRDVAVASNASGDCAVIHADVVYT